MKIETLSTASLIPYARNAKRHEPAQISKLCGSIREFGFNNPVLIDKDNGIIAGHGRVMAAQSLGLETVPCIRLGHLTDTQRRAYILADNRLAEIGGGWDEEMLKLELADLAALDVDVAEIGFGAEDLADLEIEDEAETSDADAEPQIDKAEELRAKWGVEPGQLWELGDHRLLCGDSTKKEDVDKVMGGATANIMITDPPYGVDYAGIHNDDAAGLPDLLNSAFRLADGVLEHGSCFYIFYPDIHAYEFISAIRNQKWKQARPAVLLWIKDQFVFGRGDYHSQSEPILYGWKDGAAHHPVHDRSQSNVWNFPRPKSAEGHPTMKPVELIVKGLKNSSKAKQISYEPFSGSGTTIIACEQLGRKCRAIEISPAYVAVAIQRWVDATGKEPKRLA
jgi:DNA modification methylase